jgi:hypothetical protein
MCHKGTNIPIVCQDLKIKCDTRQKVLTGRVVSILILAMERVWKPVAYRGLPIAYLKDYLDYIRVVNIYVSSAIKLLYRNRLED